MPKRNSRWLIGILALAVLPTALVNMPPLTDCAQNPLVSDHEHWFRASEIVVRPWRGRHHVHGIVPVPMQFRLDNFYSATLTIHGIGAEYQAGRAGDEDVGRASIEAGYYAKRIYLSTRTTFWILLTGRFGDLTRQCHWWLIMRDKHR